LVLFEVMFGFDDSWELSEGLFVTLSSVKDDTGFADESELDLVSILDISLYKVNSGVRN